MMLPAEIWSLIIANLDKPGAKSFSSISRRFRALALPKLFSSICFRFGLRFDTDEYDENDEERARRTSETLAKIVNPSENELDFAHMARELRIISRSLPLALKRLTKLQRFFWVGAQLSPFVIDELASLDRCSIFLCGYEIDDKYADVLSLLSNVKSIETINEWAPFTSKDSDSNDVEDVLEKITTRHRESFESFGLDSSCMSALSRRYFDDKLIGITTNLTHLSVENSSECFALRTILSQAHALESLALIESESIYLPLDENALLNLRDLKVGIQREDVQRTPSWWITNVPLWDWTFEFPRCTFLTLSNRRPEQWTNTCYVLAPGSILPHYKDLHLEQLCLHGSILDNLSISPDGKVHYEFWSDFRAFRRTEEDFCSPDAYWLMRHRLLSERYEDDSDYSEEDTEDEWTTVDEDEEVDDVVEHEEDEADDDDDIGGLIVN
ncbi:hypothetical protein ACEPAI_10108 [Sanghuangporus weigelae]